MGGSVRIGRYNAAQWGGGDERIRIAVLDGPVDLDHPCFAGAGLSVVETQAGNAGNGAALAHGTHVASIIFGQPGSSVAGIAPRCSGLIVPIFSARDSGGLGCSQLDLARAILLAIEHDAHIINISGGQLSNEAEADVYLRDALAKAEATGALIVAATGNDGCDCVHMPAAALTVLAVGAAGLDGRPLEFSNWGATYQLNGILAPGENIEGAVPGSRTTQRTGSSFAAPIVTGIAALLLADQLRNGLAPNPLAVRDAILASAIQCASGDSEQRCLAGRLNITGSVEAIRNGRRKMNEFSIPDETRRTSGGAALSNADAHVRPAEDVGELLATGSHSARPDVVSSMIPSDCGCGGAKKDCSCGCGGQKQSPPQKIFALGQIGYDFGSEARRDSIIQFLPKDTPLTTENLISALIDDGGVKPEAERIIWTLNVDQTPIYAIRPSGAFAFNGYAQIVAALAAQIGWSPPSDSGSKTKKSDDAKAKPAPVDLFSVAGVLSGEIRLMSGQTVPLLVPSARGVIAWDVEYSQKQLLKKLDADDPLAKMQKEDPSSFDKLFNTIMSDFKNIILRRYRNLGILGRERAINFASMTAFTVFEFLKEMIGLRLTVDDITVISSPACRPGSECYDVQIRAFRQSDITAAIRVFQFTLDVSDSIPVDIGRVATWSERPRG